MRAANLEEVLLAHGADFFAEDEDAAGVGAEQAVGELEKDAFADAGGAEEDAHFAGAHLEGDVFEDGFLVEANGDVVEDNDRLIGGCGGVRLARAAPLPATVTVRRWRSGIG